MILLSVFGQQCLMVVTPVLDCRLYGQGSVVYLCLGTVCSLGHLLTQAPHAMQLPLVLSFLHSPRLRARCLQGMCLWRVARYYYFLFSCSSPLYLMTQEGAVHTVFKPQKKRVPVLTPHFSKELTVWIYWKEHTQPCSHPQIRLESSWAPTTIQ